MDRKSIVVVVISILLFVLWAQLMPRLYPPKPLPPRTNMVAETTHPVERAPSSPAAPTRTAVAQAAAARLSEELLVVSNNDARYTFTSHGGGLKLAELIHYPETVECRAKIKSTRLATLNTSAPLPVLGLLGGEALQGDGVFKLSLISSGVRAEKVLSNGLYLVKDFRLGSNYLVNATVRIENQTAQPLSLPVQEWVVGTATPMDALDNEQLLGVFHYDGHSDQHVDHAWFDNKFLGCFPGTPRAEYVAGSNNVVWATVHNQFFALALLPKEPAWKISASPIYLLPPSRGQIKANPTVVTKPFGLQASLQYPAMTLGPKQTIEKQFQIFAGPKEYQTLVGIGAQLNNRLDLVMGYSGFFGWFAQVLLWSMNGLHRLGLSYAFAIISITVIIKLLFWPLTQASMRSMKRMAALQPQMTALKERYKDDATKMNRKLMEFMKENKVSPLGGCLPMLLQIPVFFGFYRMIQSAIELRGAEFLWACDLSKADTVFIIPGMDFPINPLPLVMGATMLWQARLTPPSPGMDPMQQKIMKYMPLMFLVILYKFSAGLTLYWTVQNLLTIAQMKLTKNKDVPAPAPDKALAPSGPPKKKK